MLKRKHTKIVIILQISSLSFVILLSFCVGDGGQIPPGIRPALGMDSKATIVKSEVALMNWQLGSDGVAAAETKKKKVGQMLQKIFRSRMESTKNIPCER
jgi:hypothetical protein